MNQYKIIFTGPSGAGKTTAIQSLSDDPPIKTEEKSANLERFVGKKGITVAMDYGLIRLGNGQKLHLYGTPGQARFDFMWEILSEGSLGVIVLIDNGREDPLQDLRFFLEAFSEYIDKTHLAIGITRMDLHRTPSLEQFYAELETLGLHIPIFEVDARTRQDTLILLQALLQNIAMQALVVG